MIEILPTSATVYHSSFSKEECLLRLSQKKTFPAFVYSRNEKGMEIAKIDNFDIRHYGYYESWYRDSIWRFDTSSNVVHIYLD